MIYFNEIEPFAVAWLRDLYPLAHVDSRSIKYVEPADTNGFIRAHFFGGIGGWEFALQLAGWPEGREVWTGSAPCQPFSGAGKQRGESDERHLWPEFRRLIAERRPATIFGEQVASKLGREWLARVRSDLEDLAYAVGASDLPACGVGTPHRRQRLYWVADAGYLAAGSGHGRAGRMETGERSEPGKYASAGGTLGGMGNASGARRGIVGDAPQPGSGGYTLGSEWSRFDVIDCRDGKSRRIEPGTFPLVAGLPGRVGRLRGYGNAIVPQLAAAFIKAFLEAEKEGLEQCTHLP